MVVELKVEDYKPEFAGKMNLYLTAVDEHRRIPGKHEQTVGVILVPGRNNKIVDASIPGMRPMSVVSYTFEKLPALNELASSPLALPTGDQQRVV